MKMHKKLLALAIGATIALPITAVAAGPTLYGNINVSLEMVEDEIGIDPDLGTTVPASTSNEGWVVRDNQSRIGVKGDAGTDIKGLKGIYKAEFGIEADDGAETPGGTPFSQRDIYVGLEGKFGTLKLGRLWETPLQSAQGSVDRFDDTSVDMGNFIAGESSASNVIYYGTPALLDGALKVHVALMPGENNDVDGDPANTEDGLADSTSLAVVYDKDGLYLAAAMDSTVMNGSIEGADFFGNNPLPLDIVRLVVGYSTDTFSVGYLLQTAEDVSAGSSLEDESMVLSGAYKMDALTIKAQLARTEGDTSNVEINMIGIGADYALGKTTTASAFYAIEEVDTGAINSAERTILSFGINQKF